MPFIYLLAEDFDVTPDFVRQLSKIGRVLKLKKLIYGFEILGDFLDPPPVNMVKDRAYPN